MDFVFQFLTLTRIMFTLQGDLAGPRLDFEILCPAIFPSCSAQPIMPNSHRPKQNWDKSKKQSQPNPDPRADGSPCIIPENYLVVLNHSFIIRSLRRCTPRRRSSRRRRALSSGTRAPTTRLVRPSPSSSSRAAAPTTRPS